ncbi:MAG TPA: rRNA maturation RNase YbeY [Bryobacteraceae bacterium]|nr:rRNA maturation RNase YbeY [Bryobacteraceae bacterium]
MSPDDIPLLFRHSSRGLRRNDLADFLRRLARGREIVCLLTDDRELRQLNRRFLGKNNATDVLSFPHANGGEIAISLDRAAAQAKEHGHTFADEVRILMLHGVLHLAGYDHETDSGEMARAETFWRKKLGLPVGLIERTDPPSGRGSRHARAVPVRARAAANEPRPKKAADPGFSRKSRVHGAKSR